MQLSLTKGELQSYVSAQLNNFFPDKNLVRLDEFSREVDMALDKIEHCFSRVTHHRYNKAGEAILNHLYADQYLVFIWYLANAIYKVNDHNQVSTKLYYLNKTLHAFDCMYDTGLPDIFLIFHGAGTMLGKAKYDDYFVALQGCTVGSHKGKYPVIGKGVSLTAHSSIIGDCKIGNGVSVSSHTAVFERDVDAGNVVFTNPQTGEIVFKPSRTPYGQQFFNTDFKEL
jgi:serine O-acetyltransferase